MQKLLAIFATTFIGAVNNKSWSVPQGARAEEKDSKRINYRALQASHLGMKV